ncbi:hypothetical protein PMAYCL1PPCAC_05125, partial [Pristionchus mayeri]
LNWWPEIIDFNFKSDMMVYTDLLVNVRAEQRTYVQVYPSSHRFHYLQILFEGGSRRDLASLLLTGKLLAIKRAYQWLRRHLLSGL